MFIDDVRKRRSVRTFDGKGLSEETINDIKAYASSIVNPYNIPVAFDFFDAKSNGLSSPVLTGEKCYVTAKVKKGPGADVAYGYSFEELLMYAESKNIGNVWIGGTMPREKFEQACNLQDNEIMPCVSPLGYAADKMGIKEVLMRKGVKADTRFEFGELFFKDDFNTALTEEEAKSLGISTALEAVRLAPSAVNKQPWRVVVCQDGAHFYEKKSKGYDNGTYDLQKVDMGIALYHFERECLESNKSVVYKVADPGIQMEDGMDYIGSYMWN
ncbi:MAG: nitroreductase family protein [Pseudobutyrivibrio sp.]|nr:nitroreductase family protein [Pseudobutyrivibrio sp.]